MFAELCTLAQYLGGGWLQSNGGFNLRNTHLYFRDYLKVIRRGKISLKSHHIMTSMFYNPYLGQIKCTVESNKKFNVNYLSTFKVTYRFHGAALPNSNLQRSLARQLWARIHAMGRACSKLPRCLHASSRSESVLTIPCSLITASLFYNLAKSQWKNWF